MILNKSQSKYNQNNKNKQIEELYVFINIFNYGNEEILINDYYNEYQLIDKLPIFTITSFNNYNIHNINLSIIQSVIKCINEYGKLYKVIDITLKTKLIGMYNINSHGH